MFASVQRSKTLSGIVPLSLQVIDELNGCQPIEKTWSACSRATSRQTDVQDRL